MVMGQVVFKSNLRDNFPDVNERGAGERIADTFEARKVI